MYEKYDQLRLTPCYPDVSRFMLNCKILQKIFTVCLLVRSLTVFDPLGCWSLVDLKSVVFSLLKRVVIFLSLSIAVLNNKFE